MKCPECGENQEKTSAPQMQFKIPFTKYEIWAWEPILWCRWCATDKEQENLKEIRESAYEQGLRDADSKREWC